MNVEFTDYVPVARYDNLPWTQALINESASPDGPWDLRETINLATLPGGLDPDPAHPLSRSFTTDLATLIEGWYRVDWKDAAGQIVETAPVQNIDYDYRPSIAMVARKILSRAKDQFGNQLDTFTNKTRPTDTQTTAIITDVMTEVADAIGDEIPAVLNDDAANVIALRAAMQIELDFYADQVRTERSPYPLLKEQYEEALTRLQGALAGLSDEGLVVDTSPGMRPHYSFPDAGIGFETLW